MNRKFVKENKKVLREFLGKAIVNFFTNQGKKEIARMIDKDPELRKVRSSLIKNTKEFVDSPHYKYDLLYISGLKSITKGVSNQLKQYIPEIS